MSINSELSEIFINIANSLDILDENVFKVRAYKKAAKNISELPVELDVYIEDNDLTDIPGIGKDLAQKIIEFIETGEIQYYKKIKKEVPEELVELLNVQGVGPKFLSLLYRQFKVKNIKSFEKALDNKELLEVKGIGKKKIDEIKKSLQFYKQGKERINIYHAISIANLIKAEIENIPGTGGTTIAGSLRRKKETIGDIDIITKADDTSKVVNIFTSLPIVKQVLASGDTKGSVVIEKGIQVDLRVMKPESYGAALLYFTGSKSHNIKLRTIASKLGFKINEYGLYKNEKKIAGEKEKEIYELLNLKYIPPELREDRGEIEVASKSKLPHLVDLKDIRGDLHTHSTWSDGTSTIPEMALEAKNLGYEYIAITDHSPSSRIANGLDIDRLYKKKKKLENLNKEINGIEILMGTEVDILRDGTLDYPDDVLKEMDIVIASIHSGFKMNKDDMTSRICDALENPYVHAFGHPTGRLIGGREPYPLDIDKVMETANKHNKALEINSYYRRLDLNDLNTKKAIDNGVKLIISTDAHNSNQLKEIKLGIGVARRGWVEKKDVINTYSLKKLKTWLQKFK